MCVYIHACMCVCAHIGMCVCICTHTSAYIHQSVCICVCIPHALVHVCTDLLEVQFQVVGTYKYMELNLECTQHVLVTIKPSLKLLHFIFWDRVSLILEAHRSNPRDPSILPPSTGLSKASWCTWFFTWVLEPSSGPQTCSPLCAEHSPSPWMLCIGMRFPQIFRETLNVLL